MPGTLAEDFSKLLTCAIEQESVASLSSSSGLSKSGMGNFFFLPMAIITSFA